MAQLKRLLPLVETSEVLGISIKTLYDWHHRGVGPRMFKVGKHLKVDPDDLAAWIDEQKQK
jgi:predicted DNA-binding transcriptional regulator AlpA